MLYRSIVCIDLLVRKAMGVVLRIFPRNLCHIKNNKKTELQEKLSIVTGLSAGREESQTQKFGIDHRNLCHIKNNKKTELQEKLYIVTGLCAGREESQTQKFGIDHLRWEGGLATEKRFKADV